jgi:hypothetical protein
MSVSSILVLFPSEKKLENPRCLESRISVIATAMAPDWDMIPIFPGVKKLPPKLRLSFFPVSPYPRQLGPRKRIPYFFAMEMSLFSPSIFPISLNPAVIIIAFFIPYFHASSRAS